MSEPLNVVVTGGNRGIGRAVAELGTAQGHRVVVLSRRETDLEHVVGDLSSVRTARAAAEAIAAACPRIDVLVHNAGIWPSRPVLNEDGFEQAFFTNHLAPFLLNHLLEDRVKRVVQVSAGLYIKGSVDPGGRRSAPTSTRCGPTPTPSSPTCSCCRCSPNAGRMRG